MKKIALATVLALAVGSAHALEVGVTGSHAPEMNHKGVGMTLGLGGVGPVRLTAGWEKFQSEQDRVSLVGGLPLVKLDKAQLSLKGGAVWMRNQNVADGYAGVAGLGLDLPVTKKVTLGVDVTRQWGESKVAAFDGNKVTAALKFKF